MIEGLLSAARAGADAVLAPFTWMPPLPGLVLLSVVLGLVLLLLFRWLSPQGALRRTKDQMAATVYELRLFADSPRLVLGATARALRYLGQYLVLSLPALLVLFPVVVLLGARAATHYDFRGLRAGEVALVEITLDRTPSGEHPVAVTADGPGLELLPPVVTVRSLGQAFVRIKARRDGQHLLQVTAGEQRAQKLVQVGRAPALSLARASRGSLDLLLSHEQPLSAGPLRAISVPYARDPYCWLGVPWWLLIIIISMAVAFALRGRLGVVF